MESREETWAPEVSRQASLGWLRRGRKLSITYYEFSLLSPQGPPHSAAGKTEPLRRDAGYFILSSPAAFVEGQNGDNSLPLLQAPINIWVSLTLLLHQPSHTKLHSGP